MTRGATAATAGSTWRASGLSGVSSGVNSTSDCNCMAVGGLITASRAPRVARVQAVVRGKSRMVGSEARVDEGRVAAGSEIAQRKRDQGQRHGVYIGGSGREPIDGALVPRLGNPEQRAAKQQGRRELQRDILKTHRERPDAE